MILILKKKLFFIFFTALVFILGFFSLLTSSNNKNISQFVESNPSDLDFFEKVHADTPYAVEPVSDTTGFGGGDCDGGDGGGDCS